MSHARCGCPLVPVDCCEPRRPACCVVTILDPDGSVSAAACRDGHGCGRIGKCPGYGCPSCSHAGKP